MKYLRPVIWTNPKNTYCAWGYIYEIIPVTIWETQTKGVYRITIGNIKLKREFDSLQKAVRRVEKRWKVYAQMWVDATRGKKFAWQSVNEYGYANAQLNGVVVRIAPCKYKKLKGQYRAAIGTHEAIKSRCEDVTAAKNWLDSMIVRTIERRLKHD